MTVKSYRENTVQATVLSFILALFILLVGYAIIFITSVDDIITIPLVIKLLTLEPLLIVLGSFLVVLPVVTYLVFRVYSTKLALRDADLEKEYERSTLTTNFISHLIRGDFSADFEIDQDDKLGKSLLNLRDTLKSNQEIAEARRNEDDIRNWTAEGLAKFGEILRRDNDNLHNLAYNVIKNLTDYLEGLQGGFYLVQGDEESERHFELMAFYAYGRKKYSDKRIKWGKGIIGTSAIEHKTIHITDLPDSYISVTSGLGKANPQALLVTPLIANAELFGVLEVASLNDFRKEHVAFFEAVAESTASILSTVKMNMQTARLLEESKAQSQTLAAQEEEMRQNMEELQATQEEAARQAERFLKLETTVNHTMLRAEYDIHGTLLYANSRFLQKLEYNSNSEVEGKPISMFMSKKDEEWFNRIWAGLSEGGRHFEGYMKHVTKNEKDLWTMAIYTCIRNEEGEAEKILFLGIDTTEQKKQSLGLEGIVDAVNRASMKIIFDINGNIKEYNDPFQYVFKYNDSEIKKLAVFDLIDNLELDLFNKKWENIVRGMNFQGHFKVKTKNDEEKWIRGAFSAVYNMYNEVESVVYIGNDITNEKQMEIESKKQNEILKKQEKLLRESEKELSRKLKEAKAEMREQFKEIEQIKLRNERTLEGALDAIITTSNDNRIIFFNKAAANLLSYTKDEVIGKEITMLFSEESIKEDEFVKKYADSGNEKIVGQRREVKFRTKEGVNIPVLILLSKAHVEKETTYTAFIQTIEVELF
jgi:PAS domain S-box-containing protein